MFIKSYALTHPSQPNYLGLFSGSTQGITVDTCPHTFSAQSLESELIGAGKPFVGYSEGLPAVGSTVCASGLYVRKHAPNLYTQLFTVGMKNKKSDQPTLNAAELQLIEQLRKHPELFERVRGILEITASAQGTIQQADSWPQTHLMAYATWAKNNNSLLIVQWDEDQGTTANYIATIFVGPMVKPGKYSETINHHNILRTIEDMYGLAHLGSSAGAKAITDVWK